MTAAKILLSSLLSLVIPLLIGFSIVSILWSRKGPTLFHLLIKACLAIAVGFGVSSCVFFIWVSSLSPSREKFFIIEITLLLASMTILLYRIKGWNYSIYSKFHSHPIRKSTISIILSIGFYVAISLMVMVFIFLSLKDPHGGYDGWEIWNMHARFMFRGADRWSDYLSDNFHYSHPDYPLLISASIARCWQYIGRDTVIIPIVVSMFFTFATVGLMFSSIAVLRSKSQGCLAALVLLTTPFFVANGAAQYADIPLGFFFLSTVVLCTLQERLSVENYGLLTLAGLMTGFAAWTKNEGMLFIVTVMVAHSAVIIHFKGHVVYFRQTRSFLLGLFPVLAVVVYFKMGFAPQNDWLSAQGLSS